MIYIFEGPDGSGKSTAAQEVAVRLDLPYIPSTRPESLKHLGDLIYEYAEMAHSGKTFVCDRAPWYSHLVYEIAIPRIPMENPQTLRQYWALPQVVIYCKSAGLSTDQISREFKSHKPKEYLDKVVDSHEKIRTLYDRLFASDVGIKHFMYDYTRPQAFDHLINYLENI